MSYSRPPGCVRNPEEVPFLKVGDANGFPRLWNRDVCVAVTYEPSL